MSAMAETGAGETHRPRATAFSQQQLSAFIPVWRQETSIACLIIVAAFLIPAGAAMLVATSNVQAFEVRYDNLPELAKCGWVGKDAGGAIKPECLTESCLPGDPCSEQEECGMLARLPPECPRNFTPGAAGVANRTRTEVASWGACDPYCEGTVEFTLNETYTGPVFMYYQLRRFYGNHRKYVRSRSQSQLAAAGWVKDEMEETKPILYAKGRNEDGYCRAHTGVSCKDVPVTLADGADSKLGNIHYAPAGLNPWSRWNDSFVLSRFGSTGLDVVCDGDAPSATTCTKKGIEWEADRARYKTPTMQPETLSNVGIPNATYSTPAVEELVSPFLQNGWYMFEPYHRIPSQIDEDLMVWLRTPMLSTFQKLYRRIDTDLPPGRYQLSIRHRYDTAPFDGEKTFILGTAQWTGGKIFFAGTLFVVTGAVSLLAAMVFTMLAVRFTEDRKRQLDVWVDEADFRVIHGV